MKCVLTNNQIQFTELPNLSEEEAAEMYRSIQDAFVGVIEPIYFQSINGVGLYRGQRKITITLYGNLDLDRICAIARLSADVIRQCIRR